MATRVPLPHSRRSRGTPVVALTAALLLPAAFAGLLGFAACGGQSSSNGPDGGGTDVRGHSDAYKAPPPADTSPGVDASCTAADAGPLSDAEITLGLGLVNSHKCFMCHGGALQGNNDGVLSTVEGGMAFPPNLTPDLNTGLGCWTNAQIKNAFLNGFDNDDAAICNPMPHFGHVAGEGGLNDAEATAVLEFLRSIPPLVNNVPDTPSCTLSWDAAPDTGFDSGEPRDAGFDGHHHHDGGLHDGSVGDGGTPDGHVVDGHVVDGSEPDGATRDGEVPDGGAHDAAHDGD